ncbi:MAG: Hsp20/alpha crystallin family protein [Myxococcales bacterium]|nr:Hsp20/alpha crystallin family protein [Myxococcales bacterium]MCB9535750.1 Hsp20/alpha crystallin family protein [Myxococcales bacterium]
MSTENTQDRARYVMRPPVDVFESEDGLRLVVDLPGVPKDGLELNFDQGLLGLVARRPLGEGDDAPFAEFRRRFELPRWIDGDKSTARLEAGVLTVELPKADAARPRQIQVSFD